MKRLLRLVACLTFGVALRGATYTVTYQKAISIPFPEATAAYAVDPAVAEASADAGIVTITGKSPGATHVVVITPTGVQTIDIVIPVPPPIFPKGWVTPRPEGTSGEAGYYETRYSSLPQQLTNILDFSRQAEDLSTHFHLAMTDLFPSANNPYDSYSQSSFALSSLSYQFRTAKRTVTLVDQTVVESPLTLNNTTVRGLHWQEGNWFFHAGYTSPAEFQNIFLPTLAEGVFGGGYRFFVTPTSSLTTSVYKLTVPGQDQTGTAGMI
jgi:hypothetical protein